MSLVAVAFVQFRAVRPPPESSPRSAVNFIDVHVGIPPPAPQYKDDPYADEDPLAGTVRTPRGDSPRLGDLIQRPTNGEHPASGGDGPSAPGRLVNDRPSFLRFSK